MSNPIDWLKQIAALAKTGLYYVTDPYDKERYETLVELSAKLLATHTDDDPDTLNTLLMNDDGYITPKVDVRGAVIQDDKILLVKEASDGLWTLPGGWADVGDSPSEAVEREIREESGYEARATKLMAVEDRKLRHPHYVFDVYKMFFLCDLTGGEATTSIETTAVDWFAEDELPPLSVGRVTEAQINRWFTHYRQPNLPTTFD